MQVLSREKRLKKHFFLDIRKKIAILSFISRWQTYPAEFLDSVSASHWIGDKRVRRECPMKSILFGVLLFSLLVLPVVGETSEIEAIKTDIAAIKTDIAVMQAEIKNLNAKIDDRFNSVDDRFNSVEDRFHSINSRFDSMEKNFDRQSNLIIACIAIPMGIIAILVSWRSLRDKAESKQIEKLSREIEALKQDGVAERR